MSDKSIKILVVGCGSIGRKHIRLLKEMGAEVAGFDVDEQRLSTLSDEFPGAQFYSINEPVPWLHMPLFGQFDGIIVATPNHLHAQPAQAALCCGRPVLIEKPLATMAHDAEVLVSETRSLILVGYCLRFHPGLRKVKELLDQGAIGTVRHAYIHFGSYLPDWRPGTDYRNNYAARQETGGGILMDASHELDYACWLFGKPVSVMAQMQNTGALEIKTEDIADAVLRFESGTQANIHLDYLSRKPRRGCVIIGDTGTITWDFRSVGCQLNDVFQQPSDGGLGANGVPWEPDDMYRAELRHFLACLRGEEKPLCTGEDGILALRLVEAARRSSNRGLVIAI